MCTFHQVNIYNVSDHLSIETLYFSFLITSVFEYNSPVLDKIHKNFSCFQPQSVVCMQTLLHIFYTLIDNIKGKQKQSIFEKCNYSSVQQS